MTALATHNSETLMALWGRNKAACRPIGDIVADARAGNLPGIAELEAGHGFRITDEPAALAATRKGSSA